MADRMAAACGIVAAECMVDRKIGEAAIKVERCIMLMGCGGWRPRLDLVEVWVRSAAKYQSEAEPEHTGLLLPHARLLIAPI